MPNPIVCIQLTCRTRALYRQPGEARTCHCWPVQPISRRALLAALGSATVVGAVAACGSADPAAPSTAAPSERSRQDSANDEQALLDAYDAVMAAFPDLSTALVEIRAQHADHLQALGGSGVASPSFTVPATDTAALEALRAMERAASRSRRTACLSTSDADLAGLLTFIAASEASHAPALRDLANA